MASFIDSIFDRSVPGLTKALDLTWRRHEAITSNIANAETPLYRAVDIHFETELSQAFEANKGSLNRTNSKHIDLSGTNNAHLIPDLSGATKPDGNNVDIDIQMGRLASNRGQFSIASSLVRRKLGMIKKTIADSR